MKDWALGVHYSASAASLEVGVEGLEAVDLRLRHVLVQCALVFIFIEADHIGSGG